LLLAGRRHLPPRPAYGSSVKPGVPPGQARRRAPIPARRAGSGQAHADGARGFSVEIPHNVEILHRVETFQPHSMFYFRATKSFHDNRAQARTAAPVPVTRLPGAPRSP
jgi:hypothetical protein